MNLTNLRLSRVGPKRGGRGLSTRQMTSQILPSTTSAALPGATLAQITRRDSLCGGLARSCWPMRATSSPNPDYLRASDIRDGYCLSEAICGAADEAEDEAAISERARATFPLLKLREHCGGQWRFTAPRGGGGSILGRLWRLRKRGVRHRQQRALPLLPGLHQRRPILWPRSSFYEMISGSYCIKEGDRARRSPATRGTALTPSWTSVRSSGPTSAVNWAKSGSQDTAWPSSDLWNLLTFYYYTCVIFKFPF